LIIPLGGEHLGNGRADLSGADNDNFLHGRSLTDCEPRFAACPSNGSVVWFETKPLIGQSAGKNRRNAQ
ncbi:hypothetical protein, partial [Mesorhizobium sp. M7A.F.Ca.CA.004.11.1.1]|uniref:hypothetical protein n=1 Tax=Mesorhizobium sp. M7A.F.Ca.CA.004.11.1.1 TaxID=2496698 RepID=UPI0019D14327